MKCQANGGDKTWRGEDSRSSIGKPSPSISPSRRHPPRGRPSIENRRCVEGILWILWTSAQWSELPRRYGSPSPSWSRLKDWEETGVLFKI